MLQGEIKKSKQLLLLMSELDKRGNRIRQAYNLYDSGLIDDTKLTELLDTIYKENPIY